MTLPGRRATWRQSALLTLAVFVFSFGATIAIGVAQARSYSRPAVTVLGAGAGLSILVTDGRSRLLLAAGDDSSGFGNALSSIRPFGCDRVDVLLLAGSTSDSTFLSRASRVAHGRHVEVVGNPELVGVLGLQTDAYLVSPRRFRLSGDTSVTVEAEARAGAKDASRYAWRAIIDHGATRIAVLSDGRVASDFPDPGPVSVLIVNGGDATDAAGQAEARVFVASAVAVSGKHVRAGVAAASPDRTWVMRVFAGEAKRFEFVDGGLALPPGAMPVDGTPAARP
jgi:hypothetical protein